MNVVRKSSEGERRSERQQAAALVAQWLLGRPRATQLLEEVHEHRPVVMELVYGVIRWQRALQRVRARFVKHRPKLSVEAVLLVGLYQLLLMEHVEEYAVLHECVEAAKEMAGASAGRFVNAVLRRVQREGRHAIWQWLDGLSPAIRWSHPDVLWERWVEQFGEEEAARLCEWNNGRADVVLRVNRHRIGFHEFRKILQQSGVEACTHPADPHRFLVLPRGVSVTRLPGYAEGWFYIQDPSTALAPDLLAVRSGERVFDACAAPGGKSGLLAEALCGKGQLVAMDAESSRVTRLRENLAKGAWEHVTVVQGDIAQETSVRQALQAVGDVAPFDAILLDVPCTNTGVLRRRPDAKWRFSVRGLERVRFQQGAILASATSWLRPGGRLVYSTCSLEPEENEEQVRNFLRSHPDFECVEMRRLFPPASQTDGAFAALLQRCT